MLQEAVQGQKYNKGLKELITNDSLSSYKLQCGFYVPLVLLNHAFPCQNNPIVLLQNSTCQQRRRVNRGVQQRIFKVNCTIILAWKMGKMHHVIRLLRMHRFQLFLYSHTTVLCERFILCQKHEQIILWVWNISLHCLQYSRINKTKFMIYCVSQHDFYNVTGIQKAAACQATQDAQLGIKSACKGNCIYLQKIPQVEI